MLGAGVRPMAEAEWRAGGSPVAMLDHLRAGMFSRRSVLFASAVCGRPGLVAGPLHRGVAVAERVADDAPGQDAFVAVRLPAEVVAGTSHR
jgi:hypothetical protein